GAMTEDDARPEALRRFELMVNEVARHAGASSQSAAAAKKSETAAASSKNAAKTSETNAANSAQAAAASQTASANSATAAKKSETNAKNSETAAKTSETNAKSSQTAAKTSETNAKASETAAKNSQDAAAQSESAAAGSASAAANSQKAAKTSETNAKTSETKAAASEIEATSAATRAENAARIAEDAADPASVPPLPDIWLPLNDSLEAITGYAPGYKTITIGSDEITMPVNGICQFSRASSATYIDKSGHITVAGNNVPRFEKYGLLIENQRTNMFVNSFNPDAWNKSGGISVTSSTDEFEFKYGRFTVGSEIAGTTTGRNICTVAGNKGIDVTGDDQYSKGPYVTASFRVRSDLNVRARIRFERYNSEGYTFLCDAYLSLQTHELQITGGNAQLLTANFEIDPGSGWIYFQATLKCLPEWGMVGTQLQIAADRAVGAFATGDWIEVTTPQFEYGACATSFIITTTEPATRASDLCKFPLMKNMYTMPFTFMVEVHKNWFISHNAAPRVIDSENHQSGGPLDLPLYFQTPVIT
ncbi:prophage tail fiber N-terminal domain-containing protein, partial [Escherichia coli]